MTEIYIYIVPQIKKNLEGFNECSLLVLLTFAQNILHSIFIGNDLCKIISDAC